MKFKRRKLNNGITVIMEERELPVVSLSIANRFGAINETSEIKGIAHFIEHLVFTGTKKRTHEQISGEIEKKGGILNAFTAHEITNFWFKLPSEHIYTGLDILTDILNNPKFDKKKFEKEKKVILEEIKMYHDSPQSYVFEKIEECLYEKPFGEGIIGSQKTVSSLKRDFVKEFFMENYSPENYIVTVVGKADFEGICSFLEKNFRAMKKSPQNIEVKKRNSFFREERPGIDQAHFVFAVHAPKPGTKDYYAFQILDAYLANGMSSRLFLKIREEKGLAYSIRSSLTAESNYSYYAIYIGTRKEAISEIKSIILEEFDKIREIKNKDILEAKEKLKGLRKLSYEESVNVMNELLYEEIRGKAENYYLYDAELNKVLLDDVIKVSKISEYSTAEVVPN